MSKRLFIVRHGNTFEPNETPCYVGSQIDLNLAKKGYEQAENLGKYFSQNKIHEIYSGSLKRQLQTAQKIKELAKIESEIKVVYALDEINYGSWEGKTVDEIIKNNIDGYKDWESKAIFPSEFEDDFDSRIELISIWLKMLLESENENILAVSSNGIIKMMLYFTRIWNKVVSEERISEFKVRTGNFVEIELGESNRIVSWNVEPEIIT